MKKTYFKLSLLMVFLSFLWSCRQELLQTEQDYNVQSQNITVQRLSREELQLQHPDVMQKVENLVSKKHSAKGIYTDTENGFSIDTDVAVYIQDRYGNKTYTFEAITDKKDPSVLQNIVLKDLGDGTFSVWMVNYDQELLKNREHTSTEFLKQHLTVDNLGDKKGSDIFGKYSMCFTPIAIYEYTAAIPCSSPEHHTNPAACDCGKPGHDCTPPTPSSYEFVYYIGTFDCSGGSSGNTLGDGSTTGGTTLPVGSGSGGNTVASPCSKVKKPFTKIPTLAQKAEGFATYTSDNVEHGFTVMSDANANTPNPYTEYTGVAGGVNVPTTPPSPYMIFVHTHNSPTNSTYSVPSWYDLLWIVQAHHNNGVNSDTVFVVITSDGTRYAITVDDWTMFEDNVYALFEGVVFDQDKSKKSMKIANDYYYGNTDPNGNIIKEPKILENSTDKEQDLKYFLEMNQENMMGMNIFEVNPNFTQFTRVSLQNNQINRTPCN